MKIPVNLGKDSYDIVLSRGILDRAAEVLSLDRKVMIVTDDGVPEDSWILPGAAYFQDTIW